MIKEALSRVMEWVEENQEKIAPIFRRMARIWAEEEVRALLGAPVRKQSPFDSLTEYQRAALRKLDPGRGSLDKTMKVAKELVKDTAPPPSDDDFVGFPDEPPTEDPRTPEDLKKS